MDELVSPAEGIMKSKASTRSLKRGAPPGAQSIHRAVDLLAAVGELNRVGSRLTDLAAQTGLHPSTAHRLLNALVWDGMVIFNEFSKRYYLGVRVHALFDSARYGSIQPRLDALISRIAELTTGAAYLFLPLMNDIISVARAGPRRPAERSLEAYARYPLGIGAAGIAILASWPKERIEQTIQANSQRYSEYGISNAEEIASAVKAAARAGYGLNEGVIPGVTGVGVVVRNSSGDAEAAVAAVFAETNMSPAKINRIVDIIKSEVKMIEPLDYPGGPAWA